jgi:hypothetical protein
MKLHSHAIARMIERGTSEKEIASTIRDGGRFGTENDLLRSSAAQDFDGISYLTGCGEIAGTI